ncbi:MAG: RHS repeat-associated core domain-containing protein [Actinobacteria bacterium]|nr:RHS repeat-associated core domain-containing protein [Actinomycetota bacterium]MCL5447304.1 RHS repeat-associated core domain-containing protein [Actinomycetota bacterium]
MRQSVLQRSDLYDLSSTDGLLLSSAPSCENPSGYPGSSTYLFSDPEGVRLTFNSSGTITADASYDAYGNVIGGGLSSVTPFGYAGGYTDPTGLIYLVNRYYDPSTGQFLSVDPLVGVTDQPYQYVGGDPVNGSDPLGLWWCMPQGASGPCPSGYSFGPPWNMNSPQPPESLVSPVACGKYQLWTAMGSLEYFASNGNSIGESESQRGYGPFITNSPTTTQEWQQYLSHLFPSSGTKRSSQGGGGGSAHNNQVLSNVGTGIQIGSALYACYTGAGMGAVLGGVPDLGIGTIPGAIAGCIGFAAADLSGIPHP